MKSLTKYSLKITLPLLMLNIFKILGFSLNKLHKSLINNFKEYLIFNDIIFHHKYSPCIQMHGNAFRLVTSRDEQ